MNKGMGDELSCQSTSKEENICSVPEDDSDIYLIREKVKEFLNLGRLVQGSCISSEELNLVFNELEWDSNSFDLDELKGYKNFLNEYGSIYGRSLFIFGPTKAADDKQKKVKCMISMQRSFNNRMNETVKELEGKKIWLIAEDEDNQYYIDFSNHGYIYVIGIDGIPKYFSKSFLIFLARLLEDYMMKSGEVDSYKEKKPSEESLDDRVNKFLSKNRLELGFAITNDILGSSIKKLGMNINSFDQYELKGYKEFLNKYGSICRTSFDIYKCELSEYEYLDDKIKESNIDKKVNVITSTQILFHRSIKKLGRNEKNYWLISKDQDIQYCINLEKNSNLGHVFCVDSSGNLVHFAKDFSEFLDKFFNKFEKCVQK
ncbi:MAG: SMI1/KNR4 family protein [Candidatus Cardinium sp.]|uniref:SMI1/KNR4 family protein n=1 Tax=Cardinium endosymbiont of Dermatophagoides farinae TaxID=2597823 RepID=UPI0011839BD9|nr:SMI1/KNR4 family protein [Cardinium endosymbiont of Dermatophagoides farinae]TSJ80934.1 hypothetical protein FPG78_02700 [Cardinium endosymbiont of Dermatophagoides farinae]UWW96951.1 MAG: SMI1/KNR4 family protein [Candidatus Cardinium sp.]